MLTGRVRRGVILLVLAVTMEAAGFATFMSTRFIPAFIVLIPLTTMITLAILVDAFICGLRPRRPTRYSPTTRVIAAIALLPIACLCRPTVFAAIYVHESCVETMKVTSSSMLPTLQPGDYFLTNRREPCSRWSIVVFPHPEDEAAPIAQRVIGLPGETVEIANGTITIDGKSLTPPPGLPSHVSRSYLGRLTPALKGSPGAGCVGNPIRLGPDEYYLLGDNTTRALDARLWERSRYGRQLGAVPAGRILGRVTAIYWPPSRWRVFR